MSKTVVLAEKPSVGRELARVLGCRRNNQGYIEGDKYIVTWALGHLVTLAEPEHYGEEFAKWRLDTLPMQPKKMALKVIPQTSKQYQTVKKLILSTDTDSIIIATDAGREGELVARWILAKANCKKPLKRLWISSQTDKAIKDGLAKLHDGKDFEPLFHSAEARAEADWLVGLNVTRALTCKFNAQLSAGRVQTPTLALIVRREMEIKNFKSKDYWTVNADLGGFFAAYRDPNKQTAIYDQNEAAAIAQNIHNKKFTIEDIATTNKKTPPPKLYDLTELQRDANKLYGFSPKETLAIMQRLYENYKILTYPRTDSRYLTEDILPTLGERLAAAAVGEFAGVARNIIKEKRQIAKDCINNAKVSDHHAIIPTEQNVYLEKLSTAERQVYMLVLQRFLTCFFDDYRYQQIKISLKCGDYDFSASGKVILAMGWKNIYDAEDEVDEVEQTLPKLSKGQSFICQNTQLKAAKTSPPSRYTEASLLSAMENPAKFIEDKKMKEYIGAGLGTPATRADIIDKLFSSFYVEKKDKSLIPTAKGMQLIDLVPTELREPLLTATWEQELDKIAKAKTDKKTFIGKIRTYSSSLVEEVKNSSARYSHDNLTRTPCPKCGQMMLKVQGKKGTMLVCQDRECGGRQNVSMNTQMRCPTCSKKMEIFGDNEKRSYVCACGYREKVDSFHQKLKANPKASKGDVQQYLKQQQKNEPTNNAMALALAKAKSKKS